jgi:hypothetical protein
VCARPVETVFQQEQTYDIAVGTTLLEDSVCAQQLEAAMTIVPGLLPEHVNIAVMTVSQAEVYLHFGVYVCISARSPGSRVSCRQSSDRREIALSRSGGPFAGHVLDQTIMTCRNADEHACIEVHGMLRQALEVTRR